MSTTTTPFLPIPVGARVRYSGYVTQRKRDAWNRCGSEPAKSRAKRDLDDCIAERGTVSAHLPGDEKRYVRPGYEIQWDNGSTSHCLPCMVVAVE